MGSGHSSIKLYFNKNSEAQEAIRLPLRAAKL